MGNRSLAITAEIATRIEQFLDPASGIVYILMTECHTGLTDGFRQATAVRDERKASARHSFQRRQAERFLTA